MAMDFAFFLAPMDYQILPNSADGHLGLLNSSTWAATSRTQIMTVDVSCFPWDAGSNSGKLANAWITYNKLSVFWTYDENPVFMGNSSLSYVFDLMKTLPHWVKIGFSAGTGQFTECNTIKSWKFTSNFKTKQPKPSNKFSF
ncbi:hypothetical protein CXB51_023351 [Gossypium anomalum]|uniref:Legume lectin domain-containing protein n=1 Tax=Gossypium anomalum TaxID=47600 RepID=A0A8J5YSE9_9ROSI|nr:hypothetical protein CXB51_023351 [Gossypium anomalum]